MITRPPKTSKKNVQVIAKYLEQNSALYWKPRGSIFRAFRTQRGIEGEREREGARTGREGREEEKKYRKVLLDKTDSLIEYLGKRESGGRGGMEGEKKK